MKGPLWGGTRPLLQPRPAPPGAVPGRGESLCACSSGREGAVAAHPAFVCHGRGSVWSHVGLCSAGWEREGSNLSTHVRVLPRFQSAPCVSLSGGNCTQLLGQPSPCVSLQDAPQRKLYCAGRIGRDFCLLDRFSISNCVGAISLQVIHVRNRVTRAGTVLRYLMFRGLKIHFRMWHAKKNG